MADISRGTDVWSERGAFAWDWRWLCRLSLVEPVVAVAWHCALLRSLSLPLDVGRASLLFASLWLVYMADRLLDVMRMPVARRPRTERHSFAYEHPRAIAAAWSATLLAALGYSVWQLTAAEWVGGGAVCLGTLLYLGSIHRTPATALRLRERGAKELGVATLFVAGSTLFIWTHEAFQRPQSRVIVACAAIPFFAVALQNLLHLARIERHIDAHHDSPSIARVGEVCWMMERALGVVALAAAVANVVLIATGTPARGLPLATLLPFNVGAAIGSAVILFEDRLVPGLSHDARHLLADVAVLIAALPAVLWPAPFG